MKRLALAVGFSSLLAATAFADVVPPPTDGGTVDAGTSGGEDSGCAIRGGAAGPGSALIAGATFLALALRRRRR